MGPLQNQQKRTGDTLEDLEKRDTDNITHLLTHGVKSYSVAGHNECLALVGKAYRESMRKVGIDFESALTALRKEVMASEGAIMQKFLPDKIDELCKKNNVRVEFRRGCSYPEDERWKAGIYIFKDNEIAFVILDPMSKSLVLSPTGDKFWTLKTNAPIDGDRIQVAVH